MESDLETSPEEAGRGGTDWKLCGVLMGAALFASLVVLPYLIEILTASGEDVAIWELAVSTVAEHMVLAAIAVCIGLTLSAKVDLGAPLLTAWLSGQKDWLGRARWPLLAAVLGGLGVAVALSLADPWLEGFMPEWPESAREAEKVAENMAAWKPLLASISAGITEEILFRYALMTLFVSLGIKIMRRQAPSASTLWSANIAAAILFGLAHLTNVVELGIAITPGVVLYVVIGNGIPGVLFGWLYGRWGLESAILAHALADVVVKVLVPLSS